MWVASSRERETWTLCSGSRECTDPNTDKPLAVQRAELEPSQGWWHLRRDMAGPAVALRPLPLALTSAVLQDCLHGALPV